MTEQQKGIPQRIAAAIGEIAAQGETPTVHAVSAIVADAPLGVVHQELRAWRKRQSAVPPHTETDEQEPDTHPDGELVELGMAGAPHTPDAVIAAVDVIYAAISSEISAAEARGREAAAEEIRAIRRTMDALRIENERALAAADARVRVAEEEAAILAAENRRLAAEFDDVKEELETLSAANLSAGTDYRTLMRERDALQAERDALTSALEEKEQHSATSATAQQIVQDLQVCQAHIAALEAERERLKGERDAAQQAALHAKGERDALKAVIDSVKFARATTRRR